MDTSSREPTVTEAEEAVRTMLRFIGENPSREGLAETPKRVIQAWREMTEGMESDPTDHLNKDFSLHEGSDTLGTYDQLILSRDIPFVSLCEHHVLPFSGTAHIAYIPNPTEGRVVGLSKLARLFEGFATRLQVQERLTQQVADAIHFRLNPLGVAVIVKGHHSCQCYRGVRKPGAMVTSALYGYFKDDSRARQELLDLIKL